MSREHLGLFDTPPDRRQLVFSWAMVGLLAAAFAAVLPFRDVAMGQVNAFVPVVDTLMCLAELVTATLLCSQAKVFRSRALAVLGAGYLYTALLLLPHALTFPGAFTPTGLLGAGLDTTAWLGMFRRLAFPAAIILYAGLKPGDLSDPPDRPHLIWTPVLLAGGAAAATTAFATMGQDWLPGFFLDRAHVIQTHLIVAELIVATLCCVAGTLLLRQPRSVLDVWLLVVLAAWLLQSLLNMTLRGRFTAGWYWLNAINLLSFLLLFFVLMAESNRLYARLAFATSAQKRERDARMVSVDAATAAMAHEVGQPLAAVNIHAHAALNSLTRNPPNPDRAIDSLRAILEAGQRTGAVIKSFRSAFSRRPARVDEFSLNELVQATAAALKWELAGEHASLQLALDAALPPVHANKVLVQRVLVNLVINAIESVGAARRRSRRIAIRTALVDPDDVLLEISDNGVGIAPDDAERIFDAFYTTKPTGTGLGLSLCRGIVEAHGGHLWASGREGQSATFHLQLPRRLTRAA